MQGAVGAGDTLDRGDRFTFGLHGQDVAAFDCLAVHVNGAGTALRGIASDVRASEAQRLADETHQERAFFDFGGGGLAVYRQ